MLAGPSGPEGEEYGKDEEGRHSREARGKVRKEDPPEADQGRDTEEVPMPILHEAHTQEGIGRYLDLLEVQHQDCRQSI